MKTSDVGVGDVSAQLTVTRLVPPAWWLKEPGLRPRAEVLCTCGRRKIITLHNFASGHTKSCGCDVKGQPSGAANPQWKGGAVGYRSAHERHAKFWAGVPCAHCDAPREPGHVAYRHDASKRLLEPRGLTYSDDSSDYQPLCVECHATYDDRAETSRRNLAKANAAQVADGWQSLVKARAARAARRKVAA